MVQQRSFLAVAEGATALGIWLGPTGNAPRKGEPRFKQTSELFQLFARCLRASTPFSSARPRAHPTPMASPPHRTFAPPLPAAFPPPNKPAHPTTLIMHQLRKAGI